MFNNHRYCTCGINAEISAPLQLFIWMLIDKLNDEKKIEVDYLQVFNLSAGKDENGINVQIIEHTQEQPPYSKKHFYYAPVQVTVKIFVIDSGEYSTMLKASEY